MELKTFSVENGADGIAVFTWDMAGRSMNVIDDHVLADLEAMMPWLNWAFESEIMAQTVPA